MENIDYEKLSYRFIWKRTNVPNRTISLRLLLRNANMENYLDVCSNRISSENLIDGEHIDIDFLDFPNLTLDCEGIMDCYDILKGYVEEETIIEIYRMLRSLQRLVDGTNNQLNLIRQCDFKTLFFIIFSHVKTTKIIFENVNTENPKEILRKVKSQAIRELFSRTFINKLRLNAREHLINAYFSVKYFHLAKFFRDWKKELDCK